MSTSQLTSLDGKLLDGLKFCSEVYALFRTIRATPAGVSRLRRRKSRVEKKLIEELLPITKYVQLRYRLGRYISVKWTDGNQQCDAEIRQEGGLVNPNYYPAKGYIEVTGSMHRNDHLARELLDTGRPVFGLEGIRRVKGGTIESVPVGHSGRDFIESYAKILRERVLAKAQLPFPKNTTLIIRCDLNTVYMPDEWDDLVEKVRPTVPPRPFIEVFLYDEVGQHNASIFPRSA